MKKQLVTVSFRFEEDLKKKLEQICSELGISVSSAFTIYAKKICRERRIPFEVSVDPFYSESNIAFLKQKMAGYKAGNLKFEEHDLIE